MPARSNIVKPAVGAATHGDAGDRRRRGCSADAVADRPGPAARGDHVRRPRVVDGLARRLPSSVYFSLIRRPQPIADRRGRRRRRRHRRQARRRRRHRLLPQRGPTAPTPPPPAPAIEAAREIQAANAGDRRADGLEPGDVTVRFGLHWGASLYVGRLLTSGRLEVTALGDEVNEGARIEPCAAGGLRLASKPLIERLGPDDFDGARASTRCGSSYTPLAELERLEREGAPRRARRSRSAPSEAQAASPISSAASISTPSAIHSTSWTSDGVGVEAEVEAIGERDGRDPEAVAEPDLGDRVERPRRGRRGR